MVRWGYSPHRLVPDLLHCRHYFAWWLASEAEQDEMNVLWSATRWRWDFWREATMCTTTRPLPVKDVLSRTFGADWTPPPLLPS